MSPEEFLAAWDTPLVVLPGDAVRPTNLPPDAVDFLSRAGLPLGLAIGDEKLPYHVSFWRVSRGVTPVLDDFGGGVPWPMEWREHCVIGEGWLDGGASPFWCMHAPSGRIEIADVESDDPVPRPANTSVAHLAATLVALRQWTLTLPDSHESRAQQCQELCRALEAADPEAWGDNQWAMLAEYFESAEFVPVCTPESPRILQVIPDGWNPNDPPDDDERF
jgi:hypothetical protein